MLSQRVPSSVLLVFLLCMSYTDAVNLPDPVVRQQSPSPATAVPLPMSPAASPSPANASVAPVSSPSPSLAPTEGTLWDIVSRGTASGQFDNDDNDYDMFAEFVRRTGYVSTFEDNLGGKGYTLFAPSDAAVKRTATDLGYQGSDEAGAFNAIVAVFSNLTNGEPVRALFAIVGYHLVPGSITQEQMNPNLTVTTVENSPIVIQGFRLLHIAEKLEDPQFVGGTRNVVARNGLLHGIDRVLFPFGVDPEVTRPIAAAAGGGNGTQGNNTSTGPVCFPAEATVQTESGKVIPMRFLNAGDKVVVAEHNVSSAVYLFTHRQSDSLHTFVQIGCARGNSITLSESHYIYANGSRTAASNVRLDDVLRTVHGDSPVTSIQKVAMEGLYAPHTLHGDIAVGGIIASTYTALLNADVAHAALAPVRAAARSGISKEPLGDLLYRGADLRSSSSTARRDGGSCTHSCALKLAAHNLTSSFERSSCRAVHPGGFRISGVKL